MMMLYGQHTIQFSNEKIVSLPERFAKELHSNLFVTQGFDRNLIIMSEKAFFDIYKRVSEMNIANPLTRMFLRHFLANATFVPHEEAKHIEISNHLFEYAGLPKEDAAVLVGQGDHLEVWGQQNWQEQSLELQDASKNAHRFAALDIRAA